MTWRASLVLRACCALGLASASAAAAPPAVEQKACLAAHSKAQEQRKAGHLKQARHELEACSAKDCADMLRADCATWMTEVERDMPSVLVDARDGSGNAVTQVRVHVDGRTIAEALDGRPIELDPGPYTLRFELDGQTVERRVIARLGVKNEPVEVRFPGDPAPQSSSSAAPGHADRTLGYVLGGVGVLGLASFAYFGLSGKSEYDRLESECAPTCDPGESEAVKRDFLVADVSLGVGVVALAVGAYLLLSPSAPQPKTLGRKRHFVGVEARPGGGTLGIRGEF